MLSMSLPSSFHLKRIVLFRNSFFCVSRLLNMSSMFAARRPYRSAMASYSVANERRRPRMSGSGSGAADMNAIVAPTSVSFPQASSQTLHEIVLPHSEFFAGAVRLDQPGAYVSGQVTTDTLAPQSFYQVGFFPVTPTLSAADVSPYLNSSYNVISDTQRFCSVAPILYPWQWLQSLASAYDEHCLHELEVQYVPSCVGSTAGQILLAFTPDATSTPDMYTSYQDVVSLECSTYGNVYVPQTLRIPIRKYTVPDGWKTVQTATTLGASSLSGVYRGGFQQFMYGFVVICLAGISPILFSPDNNGKNALTTLRSFTFGTLKSKYTWAFRSPVLQASLLTPLQLKSGLSVLTTVAGSQSGTLGYLLPFSTGDPNGTNLYTPAVSIDGFAGWNVSPFCGPVSSGGPLTNRFIVPVGTYIVSYHLQTVIGSPSFSGSVSFAGVPGSGTTVLPGQTSVCNAVTPAGNTAISGSFTVVCNNTPNAGTFLGLVSMTFSALPGATTQWGACKMVALTVNSFGLDHSLAGL